MQVHPNPCKRMPGVGVVRDAGEGTRPGDGGRGSPADARMDRGVFRSCRGLRCPPSCPAATAKPTPPAPSRKVGPAVAPPAVGTAPLRGGGSGMLHRIPYRVLGRWGGERRRRARASLTPFSPEQRAPRGGHRHRGSRPPGGPYRLPPSATSLPPPPSSCAWGRMGSAWPSPPSRLPCPA